MQIFERSAEGAILTFVAGKTNEYFLDNETRSQWNMQGLCIAGDYEGTQLQSIPHYNKIFWFVWADYHPQTSIFGVEGEEPVNSASSVAA